MAARMSKAPSRDRVLLVIPGPATKACRQEREHEIHTGETPQSAPVTGYFMESGAGLVEANDAVDRELDGKDRSGGEHGCWDSVTRPRKADEEERRHARRTMPESRVLWLRERMSRTSSCVGP